MTNVLPLKGSFQVPGDKSISHRALMLAALTSGESRISGLSMGMDILATLRCIQQCGIPVLMDGSDLVLYGDPVWQQPEGFLDARNSGTTIRLLSGILAGQSFESILTGDDSLKHRPMDRIIHPLRQMGASIQGHEERYAPLHIHPAPSRLHGIHYELPVASAQVKSCLLLANLFADGEMTLTEPAPSRDHTEQMFSDSGISVKTCNGIITMQGAQAHQLKPQHWQVPGDPSSAAFLSVAALLIPGSEIRIRQIGLNPLRTGWIQALQSVGARITLENVQTAHGEPVGDLIVSASTLQGNLTITAEQIPSLIDEIPVLVMAGLFFDGTLSIAGAGELRHKESDRLSSLAMELNKLGVAPTITEDGLTLAGSPDFSAEPSVMLSSHQDHRIALSLLTLNRVLSPERWSVAGSECMAVSFPQLESLLFSENY